MKREYNNKLIYYYCYVFGQGVYEIQKNLGRPRVAPAYTITLNAVLSVTWSAVT